MLRFEPGDLGVAHFFHPIRQAALNPQVDLFAVLNEQDVLSVHRFSGKAIWSASVPADTRVAWSCDGTVRGGQR